MILVKESSFTDWDDRWNFGDVVFLKEAKRATFVWVISLVIYSVCHL